MWYAPLPPGVLIGRSYGSAGTVAAAMLASHGGADSGSSTHGAAHKRLADAEARLQQFQDAIAAGVDPAAMADAMNDAQAQRGRRALGVRRHS